MRAAQLATLLSPKRDFAPVVASLFGNGQRGVLIAANYRRSLFQDSAASIPAAVGMPVVKALDLSGNGNHVTFSNVTLQIDSAGLTYLAFNGTSSYGVTAAIDFSGTDKITVFAGVHKASDAGAGMIAELTADADANAGSFYLAASVGGANYEISDGPALARAIATMTTFTAPTTNVVSASIDRAGASAEAEIVGRVNGAVPATGYLADGLAAGNFANAALYVGARGGASLWFNGRLYGLIVRGAASTAGQIDDAERYMARLSGVSF